MQAEHSDVDKLNERSGDDDGHDDSKDGIDHNEIEVQLEDALMNEQRKVGGEGSSSRSSPAIRPRADAAGDGQKTLGSPQAQLGQDGQQLVTDPQSFEDIRNPRFFTSHLDEEQREGIQGRRPAQG